MPTADAHVHLFAGGFAGVSGGPPGAADELEAYERLRQLHGIRRALVVGYEGEHRYAGNNEHVLELAAARPWIAPLAYLPADPPPAVESLRALRDRGAIGFAIYAPGEAEARPVAAWPAATLEELRAQRALISMNATLPAIALLAPFVDALDGCAVIFSHLGLPGRFRSAPAPPAARAHLEPLLALAGRGNVAVKLSALYAVSEPAYDFPHTAAQPLVDALLDAFGPQRLLWGSDFSPALDFVSFAQAADARVLAGRPAAEIDAVMGGNLLRLLENRIGGD